MLSAASHRPTGGSLLPKASGWLARNIAPLILLPVSALLLWVAIWRVWLPNDGASTGVVKTVTSTQRSGTVASGGSVVTVERATIGAPPSRRSETLVVVLLILAVGSAGVGVFHRQLASVELSADGLKITLTHGEKQGLGELVRTLHAAGASPDTLATGVGRYVDAVASLRGALHPRGRRSAMAVRGTLTSDTSMPQRAPNGLSAAQARTLAQALAAELL